MQPLQYYLQDPAAKDNSITHAAAAPSNLDATTTMRSADTELRNTKALRATASENAAPKLDFGAKAKQNTILKHFLKGILQGKLLASAKIQKSAGKSLSQPWCSHSNAIYKIQLQKAIVLRMQPRHQATLTQPLQCDLQTQLQTGSRRQSEKKTILKHFLNGILKGKLLAPKLRKSADKSLSQPWCSHSNTIYKIQLQKTIVLRMEAAAPSNLDAATTMRSADTELRNTKALRATASENAAPKLDFGAKAKQNTILKHFLKGILQGKLLASAKIEKSAGKSLSQPWCSHSNTIYKIQLQKTIVLRMQPRHQATLTRCRTQRRNTLRSERPQPQPPHTRGTFHRRLRPLYTQKYKVSCSASSPKQSPCNIHAAMTIRFAASRSKPAPLYPHGNTRWQQSCSHSNGSATTESRNA